MDRSSNSPPRTTRASKGAQPLTREQRLLRRKRITSILGGLKLGAIAFLFGACTFPLGTYPLGVAWLCAASDHVCYILAGVILSGLLPDFPLPFWAHLLLCGVVVGLRLLFLFAADRPARTRDARNFPPKPRRSAHAFMSSVQDVLWGVPMEDTLTDYYCGKRNTPAVREDHTPPPPQDPCPAALPPIPLFGESILYRLLVSSIGGFGLGLCLMVKGGFAVYDLLASFLMILICPLLTYLLAPCFNESGQELLSVGEPRDTLPRAGHTYLLHHFSGMTLISALLLLFLCTLAARPFVLTIAVPYITLRLAPILAMLLTLRATAKYGMVPGVAVAIVTGLGTDPLVSPAFIIGAITYGLLKLFSHKAGIVLGSIAGLLWVLLGGGSDLLVTYLPGMIVVAPIYLSLDKISQRFPEHSLSVTEAAMADFSASVEQKTRAEAHIDRLEALSGAFSSLSKLFYDLSGQLRHPKLPELRRMCDEVFDRHCAHCRHRDICDHSDRACHPADLLSPAISVQLYNKGKADPAALPREPLRQCIRAEAILADINTRCARMTEQLIKSEKTEVFATDYEAIADLIQDTLTEDEEEFRCNREAADRIYDFLTVRGVAVYGVVVCGKRSCKILVRGQKFDRSEEGMQEIRKGLEDICGIRLALPAFEAEEGHTVMSLCAEAGIRTTFAGSTVPAGTPEGVPLPAPLTNEWDSGEPYAPPATCGDHIAMFKSDNACFYALISDGMGSGEDASLTSDICALFLEKMLSAGNRVELSIRMLNSFIRQKNSGTGDECSATVDLMELDLMSGQAVFAKNGAAPTYVVRGGSVYKLKSRTLPIGILKDSEPQFLRFRMHPGDVVVMVSDGVTHGNDECPWLIDLLSAPLPDSMDSLRLDILRRAIASGSPDDLSAIAIRVDEV